MTKINNKRKLDEYVLKKLQDILQENKELLNTNDFKKLYNITDKSLMTTSIYLSNLTYLLMTAGIDPLKYMDEIPDGYLTHISDLISIDIPGNIKSIGNSAFHSCKNLETTTISNGVMNIKAYAFFKCSSLTSIAIPNSVIAIGGSAFSGCSKLTNVTIGNSITFIGAYAFQDCVSLKSINYLGTKEQWGKISLNELYNTYSSIKQIHCIDGDINL